MVEFDFDSKELRQKLQSVRKKAVQLSTFRLGAFFGMLAFLILGVAEHVLWLIPGVLLIWLFIFLIKKFNAAKHQEAIFLAIEEIEHRKVLRQARELAALPDGLEFADKAHPFSGDLDLFGSHSLFQLLNHTTSIGGKAKLAQLMKAEFTPDQAQKRATAVEELRQKPEFLRAIESVGMAFGTEKDSFQSWKSWLAEPQKITFLHQLLAFLGPFGGLTFLILISLGIIPQAILGVWILLGVFTLSLVFVPLKRAAEVIPLSAQVKSMAIRAEKIESENFQAELLSQEKSKVYSSGHPASAQLQDLDRLGLWVQNRLNLLYLPVNLLFWTDFALFLTLANWKNRVADSLPQLPDSLENWEVWVSLGSFELEVGHLGEGKWTEERIMDAKNASHPLIRPGKAIGNTIQLGNQSQLALLTGANMSGKTTFMRTLGINAVLVNLGLRPFAADPDAPAACDAASIRAARARRPIIAGLLGFANEPELIHRDNLVLS